MNTETPSTSIVDAARLRAGALAGLAATVPMTLEMLVMQRLLPQRQRYPLPPEQITTVLAAHAKRFEFLDKRVRQGVTLVLHFAYGGALGAAYALIAARLPDPARTTRLPVDDQRVRVAGALPGTLYALVVWAVSYLGWLPAVGILRPATDHPGRRNALMIVAHVIWGATTGLLLDRWAPPPPASTDRGASTLDGAAAAHASTASSATGGTNGPESTAATA